jgi:putative transposase
VGRGISRVSGGGNLRGVPAGDPDPLEAFRELIEKRRKRSNKRIVRLRLFPNRYEQKTLFDIGLACARLWNELSYEKRNAFFNGELSPGKRDEINRRYYHRYKEVLVVNAGQVINKNDRAWNAFFELLKHKKQEKGRLPQHIKKVSPPGYWKD